MEQKQSGCDKILNRSSIVAKSHSCKICTFDIRSKTNSLTGGQTESGHTGDSSISAKAAAAIIVQKKPAVTDKVICTRLLSTVNQPNFICVAALVQVALS